ncbi:MAG: stage V sporulation protein D [Bacilli bacterium]|nr:stage V sporulation protein D [Bacilli bacterium]
MYLFRKRLIFIYVLMMLFACVLAIRLTYLKVYTKDDYYERALELWTRSAPVEARRGNIYDRNGKLIVGSELAPTIVVIPKQIKDVEKTTKILAKVLECDEDIIESHLTKKVSVEVLKPVGQKISVQKALEIASYSIDGVYIVADTKRSYPYGYYLSQVIGICGIDNQGITGIEYIYDEYLKGSSGAVKIFTDAHGNLIDDLTSYYEEATSGIDLYLTIDLDLQITLERVLDNAMAKYNADEIMGVIMDPKTGEILAMASRPTFDPSHYQDYDQSLYNQNLPIWKSFEPGSTFKIVTFSAGLEEGVFSLNERFIDPGYMVIDGARIKDWKAGGHGEQTFLQVLQNSCNPGFMTIGLRLGKEKLFKYIKDFGFGEKTGIDLLGESTGIIFNENKIGNVELATSAFGQGNSTTAIQLITAASAAVNGGYLNQPAVLKGIGNAQTNGILYQDFPIIKRQVISEKTSKMVAESLEAVASLGTARSAYIEGYRVGGKTGTAQVAENGKYVEGKYILSFLGIAPMNDPEVACYIAVNNAKNTIQYGGVVVAPMVKEVLASSFSILNIQAQSGGIPLDARYWIDKRTYIVDDYVGSKRSKIQNTTKYTFNIVGDGDIIVAQLPEAGYPLVEGGTVILYTN